MNFKKINYFVYPLDNGIINFDIISNSLDKFFIKVMNVLENDQYVSIQFTYKLSDNTFRTLGYLNKINKDDIETLKSIYLFFHQNDFDGYNEVFKETIVIYIKYRYLDMSKTEYKSLIMDIRDNKRISTHLINKIQIPSMYDTNKWGVIENKYNIETLTKYSITNVNYRYEVLQTLSSRNVEIYNKFNKLIIQFTDNFVKDNYFIRIIKDNQYHFIDNKLIVNIRDKDTKFISRINTDTCINENIITLDLETYSTIINNEEVLSIISCCIYNGINKLYYYLEDYNSSDDLLRNAITSIMIDKYDDYKVYIHNLSRFDGIFLLRILATIPDTKLIPIIKDDKMISLTLSYGNKCKITFYDSMLLLPSSLNKLSTCFNVEDKKCIFPIKFLMNNPNLKLNYIGPVPNIKYFNDITIQDYNNYILERNNIWNFRIELLDYNMLDCISLYEVLIKFNELIFEKFSLNVFNYPTLPSLALNIYRSSFIKDHKIPKIGGKLLHDIKLSYTGGSTEMYIPYGKDLYHYDINSLYPSSMFKFDMPIGNIKYFTGNILRIMDNPFGFFKCKITSPDHLDNPILQVKYNNRTVSPLGSFNGWFFSEELFNSMKYGYTFEILEGYLFEKDNIFKDYISVLHGMKQSSNKSDPLYLIAKLLMNSLYGKFGMTDDLVNHIIIDTNKLNQIIETKDKITIVELDDDLFLVGYHDKKDTELMSDSTDFDISIGIAAAITAYSRITMSKYKNLSNNKIYYTDTDSAVMDKPLADSLVSNHLGQMVLEKVYKEFIALAPKVYGGILDNGKEMTKVKGFRNSVSFDDLKSLLNKDKSLELKHSKWFRFIDKSSISIRGQIYTLIPTQNKRSLIYKNNKLIGSKAFFLDTNSK